MAPSTRTPSPAREAELIVERLRAVTLRLSRGLRVGGPAISTPLVSTLSVVAARGPIRMGELAAAEHVEPATMSRFVDRLEKDGLVRRLRAKDDARAVEVVSTERAAGAIASARRVAQSSLAAHLAALPATRRRQLLRALDQLDGLARSLDVI